MKAGKKNHAWILFGGVKYSSDCVDREKRARRTSSISPRRGKSLRLLASDNEGQRLTRPGGKEKSLKTISPSKVMEEGKRDHWNKRRVICRGEGRLSMILEGAGAGLFVSLCQQEDDRKIHLFGRGKTRKLTDIGRNKRMKWRKIRKAGEFSGGRERGSPSSILKRNPRLYLKARTTTP